MTPLPPRNSPAGLFGAVFAFMLALGAFAGVGMMLRTQSSVKADLTARSLAHREILQAEMVTVQAEQAKEMEALDATVEAERTRGEELKAELTEKKDIRRNKAREAQVAQATTGQAQNLDELATRNGLSSSDAATLTRMLAEMKAENERLQKQLAALPELAAALSPQEVRRREQLAAAAAEAEAAAAAAAKAAKEEKVEVDPRHFEIKLTRVRKKSLSKAENYDDKEERVRYLITIKNKSRVDYKGLNFVLMVYGESVHQRDHYKVIGRQDFPFDIDAVGEYKVETDEFVNVYDDKEMAQFGFKTEGTFEVLMDSDNKVVLLKAKKSGFQKHLDAIAALKKDSFFDDDLKPYVPQGHMW